MRIDCAMDVIRSKKLTSEPNCLHQEELRLIIRLLVLDANMLQSDRIGDVELLDLDGMHKAVSALRSDLAMLISMK